MPPKAGNGSPSTSSICFGTLSQSSERASRPTATCRHDPRNSRYENQTTVAGKAPILVQSQWFSAATKAFAIIVRGFVVADGDGTAAIARAADPVSSLEGRLIGFAVRGHVRRPLVNVATHVHDAVRRLSLIHISEPTRPY